MKGSPASRLDDWLEDEGMLEQATARAMKRAVAWQISQAMKARRFTRARLAHELRTSEAAVDRLLDPSRTALTLRSLTRVALALRMDLEVRLVDRPMRSRRTRTIHPTTKGTRRRRSQLAKDEPSHSIFRLVDPSCSLHQHLGNTHNNSDRWLHS